MSHLVPFSMNDLPAVVDNQAIADDLYGAALRTSTPRITMSNGTFFVHDVSGAKAATPERHLDIVIVRIKQQDNRTFWLKQMKPGELTGAPDCWSNDGVIPGAPAEQRPTVLTAAGASVPVRSCAECPKNMPNSHPTGTGKACSWKKRVAVFLANDIGGTPLLLRVGSLSWSDKNDANYRGPRALKSYVQYLVANQRNPGMLVTRMTFNPNNTVASVLFAPATDANGSAIGLSPEAQRLIYDAARSDAVMKLMEVADEADDTPSAGVLGTTINSPGTLSPGPGVGAVVAVATDPAVRDHHDISPPAVQGDPPTPEAVAAPARPSGPARKVAAPPPVTVPVTLRADYSATTNAAMAAFALSNKEDWDTNIDWAMHALTPEKEVLEWIAEFAGSPAAPAPAPAPIVAPPKRPPGRPAKAAAPEPTAPPSQDYNTLLGLSSDL